MPDAESRPPAPPQRLLATAELLAIGTELTAGETVDTNTGELARSLVALGVDVRRISALPDDLGVVRDALVRALDRADLVVTTGGLGPTPDDLTRESVAAACGEAAEVHEPTLAWLRGLWAGRGQPFPDVNVKQAWVIPSATILANPNGTAPGWWVDRYDGRVIVTLPGPPRELRPMWADAVVPRLRERGVGVEREIRTLRLTGIGESQVAQRLGDALLRGANPEVSTYARHEAVDVRISAVAEGGRSAAELADTAERSILDALGDHVWARGGATWSSALNEALTERGWTLASVERGTGGALVTLLAGAEAVVRSEVVRPTAGPSGAAALLAEAKRVRDLAGAAVGLAIHAAPARNELGVDVALVTPDAAYAERRIAYTRGSLGPERAAIATAGVVLDALRGRLTAT